LRTDMPPYVPRKRIRDDTPSTQDESKSNQGSETKAARAIAPPRKLTLFDELDASSTPRSSSRNGSSALKINASDDDESELSSLSDADFEDVPAPKRQKVEALVDKEGKDEDEDEEDEDIEFEDVKTPHTTFDNVPTPSGDLELTLI